MDRHGGVTPNESEHRFEVDVETQKFASTSRKPSERMLLSFNAFLLVSCLTSTMRLILKHHALVENTTPVKKTTGLEQGTPKLAVQNTWHSNTRRNTLFFGFGPPFYIQYQR